MTLSIDQFVNEIAASGLVPAADLFSWLSSMSEAERPKNGEELARELVGQNKLTKFQAEQIFAGQGKSLTLGNYLILDKLGQGGMGVVLKALHRRMERVVALKVMSQAGMKSPDAVQRFHREVKAAAKLNHPNIVVAHDADEANGTHFLVMEYVEGTDLSAFVKKHGPMPVEQAVQCILQAARGLQFAHEHGVIHRDIKPSNLLLKVDGSELRVEGEPQNGADRNLSSPSTINFQPSTIVIKILDMGLARIEGAESAQGELTTSGAVLGTVDYMAPEQALSAKSADARSDIYSLGISLWYLLTGRVAYEGDSLMAKLLAHRDAAIPSLPDFRRAGVRQPPDGESTVPNPGADAPRLASGTPSDALDAVFRKMVAKQPRDRYQSMTEVIRDLERCLVGTAVFAISQPTNGGHSPETSPIGAAANSVKTANLLSAAEAETVMLPGGNVKADSHAELSLTLDGAHPPSSAPGGRTNRTRLALFGAIAGALIAILAFVLSRSGQPDQRLGQVNSSNAETVISDPNNVASKATNGPSNKPSVPDFALEFDFRRHPSTRVAIPMPSLDPNFPWTLEGYIQPADIPDHNHGLPAIFEGDPWQLNLNHWTLRLAEQSGSLNEQPNRSDNVIAEKLAEKWRGKRVHLAGVFDGKQAALFVDGQLIGKAPPKFLPKQHRGKLFLGVRFSGRMDEWRISKVARYDNDFTPPLRYESDADTVALFHFDEGDGDRLRDSSGNNHHGEITNATWVRLNDVTGGLPANGPVVSERPFVTLRKGVEAARHATLDEAFSAIQSNDVIEVRGNGPFPIGGPEVINLGLRSENVFTLKGAPGFRPLFVSAPGAQQYNVHCDTARFEDVDFVLSGTAGFDFYNVHEVEFLRCRCMSASSSPGSLMRFNCGDDQLVRFSDCFVASARRDGVLTVALSPAKVELSNTIIMTGSNPLYIAAFGSTVRLNRCTIIGASAMSWATPTNDKERNVPGTAALTRCLVFGPSYIGDYVRWQGKENVYGISQFRESGVVLPSNVRRSFDEWVKSPEKPETGSKLVSTKGKPFEEFQDQNPAVMFDRLKTYFEELHSLHPDVGADPAVANGQPLQRATAAELELPWTDWLGPKLKRGDFNDNRDGWKAEGNSITNDRPIQGIELLPASTRDAAVRVTYLLRDSRGIQLTAREDKTSESREFHYFAEDNGEKIQIASFGKGGAYKKLAEQAVPASISKDRARTLEFRLNGDTLTLTLNGTVVITAKDSTRPEGPFAFAALKGVLIQKVEVKKLDVQSTSNKRLGNIDRSLAKSPFGGDEARAHQETWAKHLAMTVETTNSGGGKMVLIPPGEFLMGSSDEQLGAIIKEVEELNLGRETIDRILKQERPQHRVIQTRPFYLGTTEVTIGQFKKFVEVTGFQTYAEKNANGDQSRTYLQPGYPVTDDSPVSCVSWDEVRTYCRWLSDVEKASYRLPTEAEWEYACRAGTRSLWSWGDDPKLAEKFAWTQANSESRAHPVATKKANPFGLFDMHGNLSEWCQDTFDETWYARSPVPDPISFSGTHNNNARGGAFAHFAITRSAYRTGYSRGDLHPLLGFRVLREIESPHEQPSTDRQAAEWVIARGGSVMLFGEEKWIADKNELPPGGFRLIHVRLGHSLTGVEVDLVPLRSLNNLVSVGMFLSNVSPLGLGGLESLPAIEDVGLGGERLGDERLAALVRLKSVRRLALNATELTPEQSAMLARTMPQLVYLNLNSNRLLNDGALDALRQLPNLTLLELNGTQVTAAGVAALQKAQPNCKIQWDAPGQ